MGNHDVIDGEQVLQSVSMRMNKMAASTKCVQSTFETDDQDTYNTQRNENSAASQQQQHFSENQYNVEIKDGHMSVCMDFNRNSESETVKSARIKCQDEIDPSGNGPKILESVLHYQRQLRKVQAAKRASTPLLKSQLQIVYNDDHMVVVNKPSGVLTVPGVNSNPSMLSLVHEEFRNEMNPDMKPEHMIVHRLDMDTSGIVVYAKSRKALLSLQGLFRDREGVSKCYEAIVCGHVDEGVESGCIDLPLQRDHRYPPFMRVATPKSEIEAQQVVKGLKNAGWRKIIKKRPKPSQTLFEVIGREFLKSDSAESGKKATQCGKTMVEAQGYPVTRLRLTPITGRTHQLRVHLASIGHPILGDPAYGIYGEASGNGGFDEDVMDIMRPCRASVELQLSLDQLTKSSGQVMCLHARKLEVKHPHTGQSILFQHPPAF